MRQSISTFVFASTFILPAFSVPVINHMTCGIPYLIPRILQRSCDPADWSEDIVNKYVDTEPAWQGLGPDVITSTSTRSTPGVWNMEPYCLLSEVANGCFCVYTSTTFAEGRGLSIVAMPLQIEGVLHATAFTHKLEPWMNVQNDTRFKHVHVPGKGVGIVAETTIYKGDYVLMTTPISAVQDHLMQHGTEEQLFSLLEVGVERLPKKSRDQFMALLGHWGGNPYHDRIHTNAFSMWIGKATDSFWAMFPETSVSSVVACKRCYADRPKKKRFNHDCRPK
jgi:hypothetical protein